MVYRRRSRAQGYVEFGLGLAVVAVIAMIGLDQMRGAIYAYFTGDAMTQTLNPPNPPSSAPSTHSTLTSVTCPTGTVELNTFHTCTARVWDPLDPNFHPTGSAAGILNLATSATGDGPARGHGEVSFGSGSGTSITCDLSSLAPSPGSGCTFRYYADFSGRPSQCPSGCAVSGPYTLNIHTITATYSPPSTSGIIGSTAGASFYVKRFAAVLLTYNDGINPTVQLCTSYSVAVGSSITCTVHVQDMDTGPKPPTPPSGIVRWEFVGGVTTGLSASTCTLVPFTSDLSECQVPVTYTPLIDALGVHGLAPDYMGDSMRSDWGLLSGPVPVTVVASVTTTTVSPCSLMAVQISDLIPANRKTKCHVVVASNTAPIGNVTWTVSGAAGTLGTFDAGGPPTPNCTLVTTSPTTAECDIWYTPSAYPPPTHTIRATFAAQGTWDTSNSGLTGTLQPIAVTP